MRLLLEPEDIEPLQRLSWSAWKGRSSTTLITPGEPQFLRRPPLVMIDHSNTKFGYEMRNARQVRRHPVTCRRIKEARQTGHRLIVDREGNVAYDEITTNKENCEAVLQKWASAVPHFHEDTDVVSSDGCYLSGRLDNPEYFVDGSTVSLLSAEPSNYGSWLFRIIPKLAIPEALGLDNYKVACWCPPALKHVLGFFGISEDRIVSINTHSSYEFEDLFVPSCLNSEAFLNEMTLRFVANVLAKHGIKRARSRRLYLSRRSHAQRRGFRNVRFFVDEDKLVENLLRLHFEIVEPENLSIYEQAKLFSEALIVVGASGAGMFNTIFCAPGTFVVDIEAFPHWLHAHSNYFSSCGHNYVMAFGEPDETDIDGPHKRWNIDTHAVAQLVSDLLNLAT